MKSKSFHLHLAPLKYCKFKILLYLYKKIIAGDGIDGDSPLKEQ